MISTIQSIGNCSFLLLLRNRFFFFFIGTSTLFFRIDATNAQIPLVYYDFESNANRSVFESNVEQDINGAATAITKVGGGSTTVSGGAGAAMISFYGGSVTGQAASATAWVTTATDPLSIATNFFEFRVKTTGFSGISVIFDAFPSATTGPNRLNLTYSIDGTTFNSLPAITAANAFRNNWTTLRFPLALADNQPSVTVRIYGFSATNTTTASLSLDNLEVDATATVPNAGLKTALNEDNLYESVTSGLTTAIFTRQNFTINTGSTLNLSSQFGVANNGNLTIASGGTLNIGDNFLSGTSTNATITVAANATLINAHATGIQGGIITTNKIFSSAANYEFRGAATGVFATTPTSNTVNNLIINNPLGVNLDMHLTVSNSLDFTAGKLVLGSNDLIITANGAINSANSSKFIVTNGMGGLTQILTANTLKTFPIGSSLTQFDPVSVTPNAACSFKAKVTASINPSYTLSSRQSGVVTPRQWDISLVSGTPTVSLSLTPSDLTRAPAGNIGVIGHWNNATWDDLSADYTAGTWTATNVSNFSPFIVSQPNTPLSITLQNFKIEPKITSNVLIWSTISEKSNAYFDIQFATDGLVFTSIGQQKGVNSAQNNYTFEHSPPPSKTHYYRLRQVDFDGTETFSKVISVELNRQKSALIIYPNPAFDKLIISSEDNKTTHYSLFNSIGKHLESGELNAQKELIISHLDIGMYVLKVGDSAIKFFKN